MRQTILLAALGLPLLLWSGDATAQSAAPKGDVGNGQKLFMADGCYQCHGTVGQGSRGTGPRLAPTVLPYEAFAKQVREPVNVMPPYTTVVLADKDLGDIYAYLQTVPPPPDIKNVTILNH